MEDFSNMNSTVNTGKTILVTGANGQLGMELRQIVNKYPQFSFIFTGREQLPIDDHHAVKKYFEQQQIDHCINCAAFTAVDKAESQKEDAFRINADAVGNLAKICFQHRSTFIHLSTDYVFEGELAVMYKEEDGIGPLNVYGASKLRGEELALNSNPRTIIIRTSWVYSSYGSNFVKTMVRLMKERSSINVVADQYGSPTYAADLALVIMYILDQPDIDSLGLGIINYANAGVTSWYNFALAIKEFTNSGCEIHSISSQEYPTAAKRPHYSVLDTSRIRLLLGISIPEWRQSLQQCLKLLS